MNTDEQLAHLIRHSLDLRELQSFDPQQIAVAARRQRHRHRMQVATTVTTFVAVAATLTYLLGHPSTSASSRGPQRTQASATAQKSPTTVGPAVRPACAPPSVTTSPAAGRGVLLASTKAGARAVAQAVLRTPPGVRLLTASLIVGAPGSTADVGEISQLPATAALRPQNQLARHVAGKEACSGQRLSVPFTLPTSAAIRSSSLRHMPHRPTAHHRSPLALPRAPSSRKWDCSRRSSDVSLLAFLFLTADPPQT